MRVYIDNIPDWMMRSERIHFSTEYCDDEPYDVDNHLIKDDTSINNIEDFKQVVDICQYWVITFPKTIYNYPNVNEALEYLLSLNDQLGVKDLIKYFNSIN